MHHSINPVMTGVFGYYRRFGIPADNRGRTPPKRNVVRSSRAGGATSEQSPLCSDVFLCLRQNARTAQKRRRPEGRLGGPSIPFRDFKMRILTAPSTSEQSPLCSDVFLCLRQKRRHPPAPLLLLSNCDPLRWARCWWAALRAAFFSIKKYRF